jgi:hypothetical protein
MTEAGEKWVMERLGAYNLNARGAYFQEADFWIRAFFAEVGKRAKMPYPDCSPLILRGTTRAFDEVKRELLGGE